LFEKADATPERCRAAAATLRGEAEAAAAAAEEEALRARRLEALVETEVCFHLTGWAVSCVTHSPIQAVCSRVLWQLQTQVMALIRVLAFAGVHIPFAARVTSA